MVLRHRDKELLRFDWVGDARVRIVAVNDAERRFLPIDFGKERFDCADDALRHPALFRGWMDFPYELTEELLSRLEALEKFRFRKQRHYNWSDERCAVLSGFLQKRADDIRRFGRKAGLKRRGSDKVGEWYF